MKPEHHMTRTQEKRAYRLAVQASLETFYGKSKPEATKLVRAWWSRLRLTKAFKSGIFLCLEAMNTAGHLAEAEVIAISDENRDMYHCILDESRDLVLSKALSTSQVGTTQAGGRKQLVMAAKHPKQTKERQVAYS